MVAKEGKIVESRTVFDKEQLNYEQILFIFRIDDPFQNE